nr:transposase and inactivated derivatives [Bradyrhizobium sp. DOA9]
MLGCKERGQLELFITSSLRQLVPDDHILAKADRMLDLSWLRGEVAGLYWNDNGRPGIDPEAALRLMLAGFLLGVVHDRRLLREAQVNIAIRWFIGYDLHEVLPDHSSLTRIRQRWGADRFRRIFERTVQACLVAKIATGEIVHIDASLSAARRFIRCCAVMTATTKRIAPGRSSPALFRICSRATSGVPPSARSRTTGRMHGKRSPARSSALASPTRKIAGPSSRRMPMTGSSSRRSAPATRRGSSSAWPHPVAGAGPARRSGAFSCRLANTKSGVSALWSIRSVTMFAADHRTSSASSGGHRDARFRLPRSTRTQGGSAATNPTPA